MTQTKEFFMLRFNLMVLGLAIGFSGTARAGFLFTEFQRIDTVSNVATGTIGSIPVTFSGADINGGVINFPNTIFNHSYFTPPLPDADVVAFRGIRVGMPNSYTVTFGSPVQDPYLDFGSLASTLSFFT